MDEITDFAAGAGVGDRLRTAGWGAVDTWTEVQAALVSDGGGGSILMIEDDVNEVHFIGVGVGAFAENDFLFVLDCRPFRSGACSAPATAMRLKGSPRLLRNHVCF